MTAPPEVAMEAREKTFADWYQHTILRPSDDAVTHEAWCAGWEAGALYQAGTAQRPMRRWLRWLLVRVLAFYFRRRPLAAADMHDTLAWAFTHRNVAEMTAVWTEACRRAARD